MKVFIVFATALVAISAFPAQEQWTLFKTKHGKSYGNLDEEKVRFQIFQDNVEMINAHNALYEAGIETYTMAVNQFADMTPTEFRAKLKLQNGPRSKQYLTPHVQNLSVPVPDSIDWRQKKAVLNVRDQGECVSAWAFSTVGAIEGQNAIKNNQRVPLSEQQLVDCDTGNHRCDGGSITPAMKYVISHGLNSAAQYPYDGAPNRCRAKSSSVVKVKEARAVAPTEAALKEAVGTVGPIAVSMNADSLVFYDKGVLDSTRCKNVVASLDHAVVAVGYGTENGKKFWILKNSWGPGWGENGYLRLVRDANDQCGIALDSSYPVLA